MNDIERDILFKRIAELESLNAQKDAAITEHQRISNEQLEKIRELESSKCEDAPPPIQAKVENMDSRLDLNVELRKRVDATEQRCAALERKVEHLELKTLGQYHESFVKPQPFDPTAMPKVGDWVECVDSKIWGNGSDIISIGCLNKRFDGKRKVTRVTKDSWTDDCDYSYYWDDRFRRVDPASKDKPHNPTCLCKDCHEDKQPATLPPFQDVETLRRMTGPERWDYYANFIECVPPEILQSQTSSMEFVLEAVKSFLSNSRLDQQRIRMLVDGVKTITEFWNTHGMAALNALIQRAGCDKV